MFDLEALRGLLIKLRPSPPPTAHPLSKLGEGEGGEGLKWRLDWRSVGVHLPPVDKVNPYESQKYCLQQEKAARLFEEVKAMLPEEGRALLVEYSDALGTAHCLEVAILGERAFLDGMRIVLRALEAERGREIDPYWQ